MSCMPIKALQVYLLGECFCRELSANLVSAKLWEIKALLGLSVGVAAVPVINAASKLQRKLFIWLSSDSAKNKLALSLLLQSRLPPSLLFHINKGKRGTRWKSRARAFISIPGQEKKVRSSGKDSVPNSCLVSHAKEFYVKQHCWCVAFNHI